MSKNKKKKKTIYIDDGRTIADMSSVSSAPLAGRSSTSSWKERAKTYFSSVKLMILPMLLVLGLIGIAFLMLYLLFSLAL